MMTVSGTIIKGYGAASGVGSKEYYPEGTIKMQLPYFQKGGLDLSAFHMGTINVDIAPYSFKVLKPLFTFKNIDWSPYIPSENFFFFDSKLNFQSNIYTGLIYLPDPETKIEHHQKPSMLELIMPYIKGIQYGDVVEIDVNSNQLSIE
jgi:hypothetical protein